MQLARVACPAPRRVRPPVAVPALPPALPAEVAQGALAELGLPSLFAPQILFDAAPGPMRPAYLGTLCVVWTADGECYAKRIAAGARPGLYDLLSFFGPPLHDQDVIKVARVHAVIPGTIAAEMAQPLTIVQRSVHRKRPLRAR